MKIYWGWVVLAAALAIRTLVHGIVGSYGEFLEKFSRVFQNSNMTIIGWIGATAYGLVNAGTPLMLILYKRIGPRKTAFIGVIFSSLGLAVSGIASNPTQIFFSYGIVTGLGMLCTIIPPFFILDSYFPLHNRYHVMTTSMLMCTLPLGSLTFNPVVERMIHNVGWRTTFSIFAIALFLLGSICAATYRHKRDSDDDNTDIEREGETVRLTGATGTQLDLDLQCKRREESSASSSNGNIPNGDSSKLTSGVKENATTNGSIANVKEIDMKDKIPRHVVILISVLWFFTKFMKSYGYFGPFFIMVKHLATLGVPPKYGSLAMTIISGSELFGRLLTSFLGDRYIKGRFLILYAICALLLAAENLMAAMGNSYTYMIIFGVLAGFTGGPVIAGVFATCAEVLDGVYVHELFTVCRVGLGTGMIAGAIVAGQIYDHYGSYRGVFYMNVAGFLLTSLLYLSILAVRNNIIRKRYTDGFEMKWR